MNTRSIHYYDYSAEFLRFENPFILSCMTVSLQTVSSSGTKLIFRKLHNRRHVPSHSSLHFTAHSVAAVLTEAGITKPFELNLSSVPAWASWPRALAPSPSSCWWSQPAQRKSFGCGRAFQSPAWRAASAPTLDGGPLSAARRERTRWTLVHANAVFSRFSEGEKSKSEETKWAGEQTSHSVHVSDCSE